MSGSVVLRRRLRKLEREIVDREAMVDFVFCRALLRTLDCVCLAFTGLTHAEVDELAPALLERLDLPDRRALADLLRRDPNRLIHALEELGVEVPPWPHPDLAGFIKDYEMRHGRTLFLREQLEAPLNIDSRSLEEERSDLTNG